MTDNMFGQMNSRKGLCTSFLNKKDTKIVTLNTFKGKFERPKNPDVPMLITTHGRNNTNAINFDG